MGVSKSSVLHNYLLRVYNNFRSIASDLIENNGIPFRAFQTRLDAVFAPKLNELHHFFVAPSISPWPLHLIDTASIDRR